MTDDGWTEQDWLAHERVWKKLYDATVSVLGRFGHRDYYNGIRSVRGDFEVIEDDDGLDIVKAEVNLPLLRPEIIRELQALLADFPGWMISVRATIPSEAEIPGMGLFVYADRVVDELKREFLPREFRNMRFG